MTGSATPVGQPTRTDGEQGSAPDGLAGADGSFIRVDIKAVDSTHPTWTKPVHAFFKRAGGSWTLVGFERLPDNVAAK